MHTDPWQTHLLPMWALGIWRRIMCPRDIHVLDAVSTPHEFYLVCDACQLIFKISDVDQTYVERG